jgi:hypothetical protein
MSSEECDREVYEHGINLGIYDMSDAYCENRLIFTVESFKKDI